MRLIKNIETLMFRLGNISVSELSRKTNIPQPTLHQLINGVTKRPRRSTLEVLATALGVTVEELSGQHPLPERLPKYVKEGLSLPSIPVYRYSDVANVKAAEPYKEILTDSNYGDSCFATEMFDSSMEPLIPTGSLMIFNQNSKPCNRNIVLALQAHSDSISIMRYVVDGDQAFLRTVEPGSKENRAIKLNSNLTILAVLHEVRIKM